MNTFSVRLYPTILYDVAGGHSIIKSLYISIRSASGSTTIYGLLFSIPVPVTETFCVVAPVLSLVILKEYAVASEGLKQTEIVAFRLPSV